MTAKLVRLCQLMLTMSLLNFFSIETRGTDEPSFKDLPETEPGRTEKQHALKVKPHLISVAKTGEIEPSLDNQSGRANF